MDSLDRPLRKLHEDASWFARARELRLHHVALDPALRAAALRIVAAMEFHADNKSPYVVLEDAHERTRDGWEVRANRLRKHWDERREACARDGLVLSALSASAPPGSSPLARFGVWLARTLAALRPPLDGLVIVLAPTLVADAAAWEQDVRELVTRPELHAVRWVVLDLLEAPLTALRHELGALALSSECHLDPNEQLADLDAIARAIDPELAGPARAGAAWPRGVLPPQRANRPLEEITEEVAIEIAAAGGNAVLAGPEGARMQRHMMLAAVASKRGAHGDAVSNQDQAFRIAWEAGALKEALIQRMLLAGYYHAAADLDAAYRTYMETANRAREAGEPLVEAQARLAIAALDTQAGRSVEAIAQYSRAADRSLAADARALAIECARMAGQVAAKEGWHAQAVEFWRQALSLAEASPVDVAKSSSAGETARQLASYFRGQGLVAQAASLEAQADAIEAGEVGVNAPGGAA